MRATDSGPARPRQRPGPKPRISREAIVAEALAHHLQDLNMRAIAERLGVTTAALYRYFPHRDALASAVAQTVLATLPVPAGDLAWRECLRVAAVDLHQTLVAHPVIADPRTWWVLGTSTAPFLDRVLQTLLDAGFDERDAVDAYCAAAYLGLTFAHLKVTAAALGEAVLAIEPPSWSQVTASAPALRRSTAALHDVDLEQQFHRNLAWLLAGIPDPRP